MALVSLSVWACWLGMTAAALGLVAHYAGNAPYWDELIMVPVLTHEEPITWQFLWQQHNEHRIPLPKLVQIGLAKLTGTDFRAGMYFTVVLMAVLAAAMIVTAQRIRGHANYVDAYFPLLLLSYGHTENFLWSFQVAFSLSTFLVCVVLSLVVCRGRGAILQEGKMAFVPALLAGGCLLLLPLCGAQGTVMVPPLALWLGLVGLLAIRADRRRGYQGLVVVAICLLACLLVVAYFLWGYEVPPWSVPPPTLRAWVRTSLEFLCAGFGPAAGKFWPYGLIYIGLVSLLVLGTMVWRWKNQPNERLGLAGMLLFLLGTLALAGALGRGRAFTGPGLGFSSRYALLSLPFIVALNFAVGRWGRPRMARLIQGSLLILALFFAWQNVQGARAYARYRRQNQRTMEAAVQSGMSPEGITAQCSKFFCADGGYFLRNLELMRKSHVGPYHCQALPTPK
jgi:hypothetical protein